jgi:hypothetical protein
MQRAKTNYAARFVALAMVAGMAGVVAARPATAWASEAPMSEEQQLTQDTDEVSNPEGEAGQVTAVHDEMTELGKVQEVIPATEPAPTQDTGAQVIATDDEQLSGVAPADSTDADSTSVEGTT